jgi:choline kinase
MIDALILVPEITKGMKSIGSKSLLEIKKKLSVLDYQIQSIRNIDKNINISICTGFDSEKIINTISGNYGNINYIYNEQYKTTNQAHSIKIYLERYANCEQLLIISNGFCLFIRSFKSMISF